MYTDTPSVESLSLSLCLLSLTSESSTIVSECVIRVFVKTYFQKSLIDPEILLVGAE